jgi:glycosyltransferase involved in cell wall biosynthesis
MYPTAEEPSFGTFVKHQAYHLKSAGVKIDILLINGRKSKWNYFWGVFRFWNRMLKNQYDLIHCHYIFSGLIGRLQWKYPIVLTHHGVEVIDGSLVAKLVHLTHSWFDKVIVVNQAQKDFLKDPAIALIPCGIDFNEMRLLPQDSARKHVDLPLDKKLVLWAGEHWQPEKRYYLVEQAMTLVRQKLPNTELVLVSGQPHSVIPYYMNACDVLVLTSNYEGSPMVVKEAMACNLPVVSTDVGDVALVIEGVKGCYLCEPNPQDISQKLVKVLSWGHRTSGRLKIDYLDSKAIAEKIVKIYIELCFQTADR